MQPSQDPGQINFYPVTDNNQRGSLPPATELDAPTIIEQKEVGQSGTVIVDGFISLEEYNSDLIGRTGLKVFDRMRKSDATVKSSLQVMKLPLLAAEWNIQPSADTPEAEAQAEFVRQNLFSVVNFHDFLREVLTMLEFGFSVFEKVYTVDLWNGKPYVMIEKLGPRKQLTILRWETQSKTAGITQQTYTGNTNSIDREKLLYFTNEQEGDNYEGVSVLRAAYRHWYMKDTLYKIGAIAAERQGVGIPQLTAPDEADETSKNLARAALRNLRANEQGYIEIPHGYIIDFMDMKGHTAIDPMPQIEHHDRQITKNVLAQFLELGAGGGGGSHALSGDQSRLFEQSLEYYAKKICEVVNSELIKQLVDFNFTVAPEGYPTLEHGKIADDNMLTTAVSLWRMSSAGFLTPDPDLEQWIRNMLHAPDLPVEYRADYNNRPRAQAATVADTRDPSTLDQDTDDMADYRDTPENVPDLTGEPLEATEAIKEVAKFRETLGKRLDAIHKRSS